MALLALTAVAGVAAPVAPDVITRPSPPPPASPPGSVEPTAPRDAEQASAVRWAIELIVLALVCSAAVALYSATAGERGGTRVPARVRRR